VLMDCNTPGQPREQVKLLLLWRDGPNGDVNVPSSSDCDCLGEDLLAGLCRTLGDD
jgi:hypothetical protein